jgi:hypothetical protein
MMTYGPPHRGDHGRQMHVLHYEVTDVPAASRSPNGNVVGVLRVRYAEERGSP